jgi:hypothetical protein
LLAVGRLIAAHKGAVVQLLLKILKGKIKMSKEFEIMKLKNRISLLTNRDSERNVRLINKAKRRLRKLGYTIV